MSKKTFKVKRPSQEHIAAMILRAAEVRKTQGEAFAAIGAYSKADRMKGAKWYQSIENSLTTRKTA